MCVGDGIMTLISIPLHGVIVVTLRHCSRFRQPSRVDSMTLIRVGLGLLAVLTAPLASDVLAPLRLARSAEY